nr:lytic murein transglycosylase B [Arenimonas sp. SCN 70-307]
MRTKLLRLTALLLLWPLAAAANAPSPDPALREAFLAHAAERYALTAEEVETWLARSAYRQGIVNAMARPAERTKAWREYRPIFISDRRIADGRAFLARHRAQLEKVQADTGVPAELIVAIIGVETSYGGNTGSHQVLDALYTLGFFYPVSGDPAQVERETNRGRFFRDELAQVMLLAKEEQLDLAALKGSYAGAMGYGQFMPSSYRAYARDGDGDGRRDLFGSLPDVFASIANYFVAHGWQPGQPVVALARKDEDAEPFVAEGLEAKYTLAELGEKGYRPAEALGHDLKATLVTLEGSGGTEHWLGFQNFYAITRYNRSPMYAMAVHQLSREIAAGAEAAPAP